MTTKPIPDETEDMLRGLAEMITARLGQHHGFVLCLAPAIGRGRVHCATDLKSGAAKSVMEFVCSKMDDSEEPVDLEVLH